MGPEQEKLLPVSSSVEPNFAPEQRLLFQEVLRLMNERRVPYVVSGAFALQQHTGIWRDTKDLDLFLPGEHAAFALQCLADDGFETHVLDPVWLAKAHRSDFYVDLITGMSNAAIVVDQSWIDHGTPADIVGVPSRVLAAEELIASKLFVTRRERFDGADIAHVIFGTKGNLRWTRLMHLVGEHWEILLWALVLFRYCYPAEGNYIPYEVWCELISRFQAAVTNTNHGAKFRGSLIDDKMFAIDVNEWGFYDLLSEYRQRREPRIVPATPGKKSEPAA
jgi:Nucleotidyl transferase of unknown function (DUF2204)